MAHPPPDPESTVLWDVAQEHLDEAGFCALTWQAALRSPLYTLSEIQAGPEERLCAHLDGLVIAGEAAVERLLAPALFDQEDVEPGAPQAAALVLVSLGHLDLLQSALVSEQPDVRRAASAALALSAPAAFDRWLLAQLPLTPPGALRGELWSLSLRRRLPLGTLPVTAQEDSKEELSAALLSARRSPELGPRGLWEELLHHPDPAIAEDARRAGLCRGSEDARRLTQRLAAAGAPDALLDLALFGQGRELDLLGAALDDPARRVPALRAAAYSGRVELVPALLGLIDDQEPLVARLAGEALSLLTGLDLSEDPYNALPPEPPDSPEELEADDLDADLVPSDDDDLPLPAAAPVRAWCARHMPSSSAARVLAGEPWTVTRALDLLDLGPAHRRATLAWWLEVHSGGQSVVDPFAWVVTQQFQLIDARRSAQDGAPQRPWS
jgi:uncharacterized protein (TIGR02270 family)